MPPPSRSVKRGENPPRLEEANKSHAGNLARKPTGRAPPEKFIRQSQVLRAGGALSLDRDSPLQRQRRYQKKREPASSKVLKSPLTGEMTRSGLG